MQDPEIQNILSDPVMRQVSKIFAFFLPLLVITFEVKILVKFHHKFGLKTNLAGGVWTGVD